ncbi:MAG: PsbP-related protein [Bacteroidota bacterium]|nr:PsbP-related protein [Bacteroidota bacterium]MDP4229430.1 PsbP-related protein [Bacteroidota bacterium]MDP4235934.1 PsbP-related protein [Bacteroidota bacterium]
MKRTSIYIYIIALTSVLAIGCGKKSEDMTPVQPGETTVFRDQVYKFSFKAPKSWVVESVPGATTAYYSSQGSEVRFQKFTEGDYGAKIEVGVRDGYTKEQAIEDFKKSFEGITFKGPEPATLENLPALKISFSAGAGDDAYMGYRIYGNKDSVVTYFEASTFGQKRMDKYKSVFDLAEKSLTLGYVLKITGKMDSATMAKLKEETKPSENFTSYSGAGFSISYPDNFNIQTTGKGVKFEGEWKGATIIVDVTPSNNASLDAYTAAAAKALGGSASGTTIGGEPAKVINYSAASGYGSRAYLVVKGANAYRITINWPKELESSFRPAFEKAATSFKLK